jgi:hypothetical protein
MGAPWVRTRALLAMLATFVALFDACAGPPTPLETPTPTIPPPITQPAPTPILLQVTNLTFFDYNGNGIQDSGEPPIEGIKLTYQPGDVSCITDKDGKGTVNIQAGSYKLSVNDPSKKFRYIFPSVAEVIAIEDGLSVMIDKNSQVLVPLAEGFLTLPILSGTKYEIDRFYDRNPDPDKYLWWNGKEGLDRDLIRGYAPNHIGIDYYMNVGEPLVAPAPGVVDSIGEDEGGKYIFIRHSNGLETSLGHISKATVSKGDFVVRGQKVAESGMSGKNTEAAQYPHTHFQLIYRETILLDPYKPLFNIDSFSGYYDFTDGLHWVNSSANSSPNMQNHWTKSDDPQYP